MSGPITSMIRIAVAAFIGTVVRIAANKWAIDVDGETLTAAITGAFIGGYYAIAKIIEAKYPALKLLGLADPDTKT